MRHERVESYRIDSTIECVIPIFTFLYCVLYFPVCLWLCMHVYVCDYLCFWDETWVNSIYLLCSIPDKWQRYETKLFFFLNCELPSIVNIFTNYQVGMGVT